MQALALSEDIAPAVQEQALSHGLIVNAIGQRTLRMVPALTVGPPQVDRAVGILAQAIDLAWSGVKA